MHLALSHALVLVSACLSVVPVFATPGSRRGSSDAPNILGPVAELNIVNKVIAPDGFPRS